MSSWRPALRIARRDALRAKGRSALVAAMVGLPVALVCGLTTLLSTSDVSAVESIPSRLGATQAELQIYGDTPVAQDPTTFNVATVGETKVPALDPAAMQQRTGGTVLDLASSPTTIRTPRGRIVSDVLSVDPADPRLRGVVRLRAGRMPTKDDEVLVTRSLVTSGYPVGATIALADGARPATVVGVSEPLSQYGSRLVIARPGLDIPLGQASHRYLLDRDQPVLWPEVRQLNAAGLVVFSRAVVQHPPASWRDGAPPEVLQQGNLASADIAILVIIIFSVVLEVVLLAGPAFAVGVRRQSRQLALLAATGGSARDVRRVVLAQAVVLGAGSALVGAALGIGGAAVMAQLLPRFRSVAFGPFDVDWRPIAAATALGALASLLAALVPALSAARADVVSVLVGRRGQAPSRRGWPVLGALVMAAGAAAALTLGTRAGGEFAVAGGTLCMVIGMIAAMPWLIGLVGRLGAHLPLPLRLATRDSARQRSRTAPAVAAVMAAVAGVTALSIGYTSDFEQSRRDYQPRQPAGVTTVASYDGDARTWGAIDAAVAREVPGRPLLEVGTIGGAPSPNGVRPRMQGVYVRPAGCPALPPREDASAFERCGQWAEPVGDPVSYGISPGLIASPETLAALGYQLTAAQRRMLEAGGVLMPRSDLVRNGQTRLTTYLDDTKTYTDVRTRLVPAAFLAPMRFGGTTNVNAVIATPAGAKRLELRWARSSGVLAPATTSLDTATEDRLRETVRGITENAEVYTERGFVQSYALPIIGLGLIAGLAVLVGTLTATGLALADSRPDLATLAAIGARPRTRRVMAAAQALVIGLLGAVSGVVVGLVPGIAVTWPLTSESYDVTTGMTMNAPPIIKIPWLLLLGVALAVPALAAGAAGLGVRSRLPLTRRLGQ